MAVIDFSNYSKGFKSDADFYSFQQAVAGLTGKNTGGAEVTFVEGIPSKGSANKYESINVQAETQ